MGYSYNVQMDTGMCGSTVGYLSNGQMDIRYFFRGEDLVYVYNVYVRSRVNFPSRSMYTCASINRLLFQHMDGYVCFYG